MIWDVLMLQRIDNMLKYKNKQLQLGIYYFSIKYEVLHNKKMSNFTMLNFQLAYKPY